MKPRTPHRARSVAGNEHGPLRSAAALLVGAASLTATCLGFAWKGIAENSRHPGLLSAQAFIALAGLIPVWVFARAMITNRMRRGASALAATILVYAAWWAVLAPTF